MTMTPNQSQSHAMLTRRRFLAGTATTATALGFPALIPRVGRAQGTTKVTMWSFPLTEDDQSLFKPIQDAFKEQNPGIEVDVQIEPWDGRENKMLAAIAAGNPPDVVYLNPDFYPKFVATETIVPLNPYLPADAMTDFLPGPTGAVTYNDQVYGLPILTSIYTELYNQQLIEAAGIAEEPTTWETFRAAVEKVHDPSKGVWGAEYMLDRPSPVTTFVPFLRMAGGKMYADDGKSVTFDGPEGQEALSYLVGFYRDGLVQESNINGGGMPFSSGKIGYMIQAEPSDIRAVMKDNPDLQLGITPTLQHKRKTNFGTVGSYALFKQSSDARYEAAAQWIAFLTNPENTTTILKASGFISPRASIKPDAYVSEPIFREVAGEAQYAESEPKNVKSREVFAAMQPEFEAAYLGTKSAQDALKSAAEASNKLLSSS